MQEWRNGRRIRLKIWRGPPRVGSSPISCMKKKDSDENVWVFSFSCRGVPWTHGSRSPRPYGLRRSVRREKGSLDLFLNPSHPISCKLPLVIQGFFFLSKGRHSRFLSDFSRKWGQNHGKKIANQRTYPRELLFKNRNTCDKIRGVELRIGRGDFSDLWEILWICCI